MDRWKTTSWSEYVFSVEVVKEKPHHEVKNTEDFIMSRDSVCFQFNGQVEDHIMDRMCDFRTCGWKMAKRIPEMKLTEGRQLPGQNVYVPAGLMDVFQSWWYPYSHNPQSWWYPYSHNPQSWWYPYSHKICWRQYDEHTPTFYCVCAE